MNPLPTYKPETSEELLSEPTDEARKEPRASPPPDFLRPRTQSDPAAQDYLRFGESARTVQCHYDTMHNTRYWFFSIMEYSSVPGLTARP